MSEDIEIINQNTAIEKFKIFFSNNFKKALVLLILLILFLFTYFGYQEYKKRIKIEIAETYNQITQKEIASENTKEIKKLIEVIKAKDPVYSALSLYFIIENNLVKDQKEINGFFDLVIKSQTEKEIKNLIIYKKAMYNADVKSENELLEIVNPILKSESIWKPHALYLMAEYYLANKQDQKSKEFFNQIISLDNAGLKLKTEAQKRLRSEFSE